MRKNMSFITTNDDAMGNSNFERKELDYYPTPSWVTAALIDSLFENRHVSEHYNVWEPAAGEGHMVNILTNHFLKLRYSDIKDYGYQNDSMHLKSFVTGDFLADTGSAGYSDILGEGFHAIITNPPYGDDAEKFIRKALQLSGRTIGVCAFLLRNEYDCSKGRVDLFNQYPFARKIVLTSRPKWIEGSTGAPRHNYSWYIWDYKYINKLPVIEYYVRPSSKKDDKA
jgi:hypothetical protein